MLSIVGLILAPYSVLLILFMQEVFLISLSSSSTDISTGYFPRIGTSYSIYWSKGWYGPGFSIKLAALISIFRVESLGTLCLFSVVINYSSFSGASSSGSFVSLFSGSSKMLGSTNSWYFIDARCSNSSWFLWINGMRISSSSSFSSLDYSILNSCFIASLVSFFYY